MSRGTTYDPPAPRTLHAAGLTWTERYNCHTAELGPGLYITVNWSSTRGEHFRVEVLGRRLAKDFVNWEEGAAAGVRFARKMLSEALGKLPAVTP